MFAPLTAESRVFVGSTIAAFNVPACDFVQILCIGPGGGGCSGRGDSFGNPQGGSGGGGGGATMAVYPTFVLPKVLYIEAPVGGLGGAGGAVSAANSGGSASPTIVRTDKRVATPNYLAAAGGGSGGIAGNTAGGVGGTANGGLSILMQAYALLYSAVAGNAGGVGANGPTSTSAGYTSVGTGLPILGGAGGGAIPNSPFAGGGITAVANSPFIGYAGVANGLSQPVCHGFVFGQYPVVYGGCGGGGGNSAVSPGGGNRQAFGAGGGGGGGGGSSANGAAGGDGGPGLVVISWW